MKRRTDEREADEQNYKLSLWVISPPPFPVLLRKGAVTADSQFKNILNMKKSDLLKSIAFAIIMALAVMSFVSCSEDDIIDPETPSVNPSESDCKPGDNFYMFVNKEWHEKLVPTKKFHGFIAETEAYYEDLAIEIMEGMEEYKLIQQALNKLSDNEAEAVAKVDSIIDDLLGNAKTKESLLFAIGKSIRMGMYEMLEPSLTHNDSQLCLTLSIPEREEENNANYLINTENYRKLDLTRSSKKHPIKTILEGMGIETEDYLHIISLDEGLLKHLNELSLEQLRDTVAHSIRAALLPYCADRYAQEYSNGKYKTTKDLLKDNLPIHMKYPVSYHFINKFISKDREETFKEYGKELRSIFAKRIENNTWLTEQAKQKAIEKLSAMTMNFGRPEKWFEEGFVNPKGELLVEDMLELKNSHFRMINALKGLDKRKHSLLLLTYVHPRNTLLAYNACYIPSLNIMCILPTYMMEPSYHDNAKPSEKYASLYVLGHEMTHGFDNIGSTYNHNGLKQNWWTPEDSAEFNRLSKMLINQFNSFEVAPGIFANGEITVGENIADLGGVNLVYDAMCEKLKKEGITSEEQLEEEKKNFFITYAKRYNWWMNEEMFQKHLDDVHSFPILRVNGIVQHMDCWYDLFGVQEGDSLYLPKDKRARIW